MDSTLTRPGSLWEALQARVLDMEIGLARAGQAVGAVGTLLALVVAVAVEGSVGWPLLPLCVLAIVWFTLAHRGLKQGRRVGFWRSATPVFEIVFPGVAFAALIVGQGPAYALGSWVPPQLFALFMGASLLRMRPLLPAALGALAALEYGAVYAWGAMQLAGDGQALHQPDMQAVRMASLALMGLVGSAAVSGMRRAVDRAAADVREKDLFGKYKLGRTVAAGGMGKVLEARYCPEGGFERVVAVKLIHPHLALDARFIERFRSEAELSARLVHPNIVASLDFGRVGETYFLSMEFVDGPTLREVFDHHQKTGAPLDVACAVQIGREIAAALHHAHAVVRDGDARLLRIVHRDLSPGNVMISRSGQVKVLDFGVARALRDTAHVHTRTLEGKPGYLAPETLREDRSDERSDLWALAVLLGELLANDRLFHRSNDSATMLAVVEAPIPSIAERRPDLHGPWEAFFERALSRDPDHRFASAAELDEALAFIQSTLGPPSPQRLADLAASVHDVDELLMDDEDDDVPGADEAPEPPQA
jgi:serine/threonine-protein kinase